METIISIILIVFIVIMIISLFKKEPIELENEIRNKVEKKFKKIIE